MEQERLDELNRQNEAMRRRFQKQQALDDEKDMLAKLAVSLVDKLVNQEVRFPKKSQLQNFRTAAAGYVSVQEIKIYITYQMSRSQSPLNRTFGKTIIDDLDKFDNDIEKSRLFLGYFCRYGAQFAGERITG